MQPKFTQRKLGFVCLKIFAMAMIVLLTSQVSFAQQQRQANTKATPQQQAERERQKLQAVNAENQSRIASSLGPAPVQIYAPSFSDNFIDAGNPLSRAFNYNSPGAGSFQFNAQNLLSTALTPRGGPVPFGFPGAMAWHTVTNVLYVVDQAAPYALYRVDTLTGARTFVVNCTGVPQANLTGITWDPITNTMYGVSSSITVSQIFTLNITTGVCTPIGAPTAVVAGAIMINASPGGSLFSVDIVSDNLYKWNKTTGVPTLVGPLGINTNFGQDGHFDLSDGQLYWATINAGAGNAAQFRVIDTTNGSSTLIGTYPGQVATLGIYSIPLIPCSGTPVPGNTISSVSTACAGVNFTLSIQNTPTTSGNTYQWQASTDGGATFTNIVGATGSSLTRSQTVATCYRVIVTCTNGGASGTSTPVCVALTPPSSCYCTPPPSDCTDDDVITRVRISTLDNASTCGTGPPLGYTNYTTTVAAPILFAGAPNPIIVNKPTIWSEGVAVWIDYNQNGNFEASELTSLGTQPAAQPALTGNINVPTTALTGVTRMRVRMQFAAVPAGACTAFTFGETEDYNVNIQPCVPITITGQPSNATIVCGGNASFTITTSGSLPVYRWEYRPNASSAWQFVPAGAPYSGENTATLTITNASAALNGFQYRATVIGGCSATDVSQAATLTVNPIVPTVTPSSATICLGSVQQLSLTNTLGNTDLISEGFNTMTPAGWTVINRSAPLGTTSWFQGDPAVFPSQSGAANAYAAANFNNTGAVGQISTWMITPAVAIKNGDQFRFWSRKVAPDLYPDRLQVRMSQVPSTNVGATALSVGDFTTLLLDINPTEVVNVYPVVWTQYTVTISGLAGPVNGNFAFRYFISNAGSNAANGDYIGVDNVTFTSTGGLAQGIWTGPAGTMFTDAAASTGYTGTPATTIYVKPLVPGVNNYQVNFTTPTPCASATTTVPVTVIAPPAITTNPVNRTVCDGGSTSFSVTPTGTPVTYQWQVSTDGGLTYTNIAGATSATYNLSGITTSMTGYRYRVVLSAAPCTATVTSTAATLTVNSLPVVTLSSPDLLLIPGQVTSITASSTPAAAANGYVWTLNGNVIAGNNTNTISGIDIDKIGTYVATVTDVNGCSASSASITIGSEASDNMWIYPNPSTGQFQVRVYYDPSSISEKRAVYLYNSDGQLMASREFDLVNTSAPYMRMDFDLGRAAKGTYVVKVVHKYTGKIKSGLVVIQ